MTGRPRREVGGCKTGRRCLRSRWSVFRPSFLITPYPAPGSGEVERTTTPDPFLDEEAGNVVRLDSSLHRRGCMENCAPVRSTSCASSHGSGVSTLAVIDSSSSRIRAEQAATSPAHTDDVTSSVRPPDESTASTTRYQRGTSPPPQQTPIRMQWIVPRTRPTAADGSVCGSSGNSSSARPPDNRCSSTLAS